MSVVSEYDLAYNLNISKHKQMVYTANDIRNSFEIKFYKKNTLKRIEQNFAVEKSFHDLLNSEIVQLFFPGITATKFLARRCNKAILKHFKKCITWKLKKENPTVLQ